MVIRFNLRRLINNLEEARFRSISNAEFSRLTGCSRTSIQSYMNNKARRVDLDNVIKILTFFKSRGFDYTMDDLFTITTEEEPISQGEN